MDATTLLITGIRGLISVLGQIQDLLADLCAAAQMLQKIEKGELLLPEIKEIQRDLSATVTRLFSIKKDLEVVAQEAEERL